MLLVAQWDTIQATSFLRFGYLARRLSTICPILSSEKWRLKKLFVANAFVSQVNTHTMHINSTMHNNIALFSPKTLYSGGI
jgi:hypothetical protein